jgi:Mg2+ and Co2+ transporter CorA
MKKSTDEVTEAIKSIQNEVDHILETLKDMQKEKRIAGMKAPMHILRDNAMAIREFSLKILLKKDNKEKIVTKHLSEDE